MIIHPRLIIVTKAKYGRSLSGFPFDGATRGISATKIKKNGGRNASENKKRKEGANEENVCNRVLSSYFSLSTPALRCLSGLFSFRLDRLDRRSPLRLFALRRFGLSFVPARSVIRRTLTAQSVLYSNVRCNQ